MTGILVSFAPPTLQKLPREDRLAWNLFNDSFQTRKVTAEEFHALTVGEHRPFTAHHQGRRESHNFLSGQHVGVDFDTRDYRSRLDYLQTVPLIRDHASFAYTTPSHTDAEPKARVVFVLDRPIQNADKYRLLINSIIHALASTDKACSDVSRFFYGAGENPKSWFTDKALSLAQAVPLVNGYTQFLSEKEAEIRRMAEQTPVLSAQQVSPKLLSWKKEQLLTNVRVAPDGQKHYTLRDNACTFGGYIAGGYFSYSEVANWLYEAILSNPNNVQDKDLASRTIAWGLQQGMRRPIHFRQNVERTFEVQSALNEIYPPLADTQIEQVERILSHTSWVAYHQGMEDAHKQLWQDRYGFSAQVVDNYGLGYRARVVDTETGEIMLTSALTVPFTNGTADCLNVEYRQTDGAIEYAMPDKPYLFYPPKKTEDVTLLLTDTLHAIGFAEQWGYDVAALPHLSYPPELATAVEGGVLFLGADETSPAKNLMPTVHLPVSIPEFLAEGWDVGILKGLLQNA